MIGKEESQKCRVVASDVCMKVKGNFCEVVAAEIFSLERLKSSILLTLFSLFEVKVRPDSACIFCVEFSRSISSVSVNVSKSFCF